MSTKKRKKKVFCLFFFTSVAFKQHKSFFLWLGVGGGQLGAALNPRRGKHLGSESASGHASFHSSSPIPGTWGAGRKTDELLGDKGYSSNLSWQPCGWAPGDGELVPYEAHPTLITPGHPPPLPGFPVPAV